MVTPDQLPSFIRSVPDFPKKGIMFRDITTLLKHPEAFRCTVDALRERYASMHVDAVVGIESRGFIVGATLAYLLNVGFIPARKPGKLPSKVAHEEYELEYGRDALEIHSDAVSRGNRILVHDDLLATGGTAAAACRLIEGMGGTVVGCSFLIELTFLHGRKSLEGRDVHSLIRYSSEEP